MSVFTGFGCQGHNIACDEQNNVLFSEHNKYKVSRESISQYCSLLTASLVKIIIESHHSWPKLAIHDKPRIVLYILKIEMSEISYFLTTNSNISNVTEVAPSRSGFDYGI